MYGWALGFGDDEGGVMLAAAPPKYFTVDAAKRDGMHALDRAIESGFPAPEQLMLIVVDEDGETVLEARARRVSTWN